MRKYFTLLLFLLLIQSSSGQNEILENYIRQGLSSNLALKQEVFSLEKSMAALREARGTFMPSLSIEARYSRAGGGRIIYFPVGDLINPIHQTLNQLLVAQGANPVFQGNLPNERIPFLREREHETKLRITQPIFQPALLYNYKIKSNLKDIQQIKYTIFKRQLVADIKTAYFNYLKTIKIVELLKKTKVLLDENLRVSTSLFKNQKATEDVVFRAKAELSDYDQREAEAEKNRKIAAAYFNFLLNRPLDSEIVSTDESDERYLTSEDVPGLTDTALKNRGEFSLLRESIHAAGNTIKFHETSFLPGITGIVDYGFQGEEYSFTDKDDYWMASVIFYWNLFNGFQDISKRTQAVKEKNKLETQLDELKNQIKLQVSDACNSMIAAKKAIVASLQKLEAAKKTYDIVSRKYEQGMAPHIELIDARNTFTQSQTQLLIAQYDFHIKEAEIERVCATYKFEK